MNWVRVDQVLDALLPPRCVLCGQRIAQGPVCAGCEADLPWLPACCVGCGLPLTSAPLQGGTMASASCGACPPAFQAFASVRSALAYAYPVDRLVAAAKFGRQLPVARALGELLALRLPLPVEPPDAVVPVPLHWRREAERGFNQAEEIARALCLRRDWPLRTDLCRRIRATPEQSGLRVTERQQNLLTAFVLREARWRTAPVHRVLLVDDVLTTGATTEALAAVLRQAGVDEIHLCTVARTLARSAQPAMVPAQPAVRNV